MKKLLASCLILIMLLSLCGLSSAEGTVRKLPIDLTGGAPLQTKFDGKMTVYEDPSIRVERDKVSGSKWGCVYYTAFITIADASQLRTLPADAVPAIMQDDADDYRDDINEEKEEIEG